jgi:hypothetical protein
MKQSSSCTGMDGSTAKIEVCSGQQKQQHSGVCLIIAALIVTVMPRPQTTTGRPIGRFQMLGTPGHAYVCDTTTGQVWEQFAPENQGGTDADFSKPKVD